MTTLRQALGLLRLAAPLHPIFVHFTVALTATSFVFDLLARLSGAASFESAGWWTLAAAVLATIATLATGVRSRLRLPIEEGAARSFLRLHMALGPMLFGLLVAVGIWRGALWEAGQGPTAWSLAAMAGIILVMVAQGYLGGELVYRYGAEVKAGYRPLAGRPAQGPPPLLPGALVEQGVIRRAQR